MKRTIRIVAFLFVCRVLVACTLNPQPYPPSSETSSADAGQSSGPAVFDSGLSDATMRGGGRADGTVDASGPESTADASASDAGAAADAIEDALSGVDVSSDAPYAADAGNEADAFGEEDAPMDAPSDVPIEARD